MKSLQFGTLIVVGAVGLASIALAASPADTILARQANFKTMGRAMHSNMQQLTAATPDIAVIRENADQLSAAAGKVSGYFPAGTGPEAGTKTSALPAIWEKPDEFQRDASNLVAAAARLKAAAASGNIDQIKQTAGAVGGTCKACHDNFRAREN